MKTFLTLIHGSLSQSFPVDTSPMENMRTYGWHVRAQDADGDCIGKLATRPFLHENRTSWSAAVFTWTWIEKKGMVKIDVTASCTWWEMQTLIRNALTSSSSRLAMKSFSYSFTSSQNPSFPFPIGVSVFFQVFNVQHCNQRGNQQVFLLIRKANHLTLFLFSSSNPYQKSTQII